MPCLNEAETIGGCVEEAVRALRDQRISGEVVVADNGSTDGSQEIATRLGARVLPVAAKGYGHALQGGIAAARGRFILMGDSDGSYDFTHASRFLDKLREGWDLVMGNRFLGGIQPGAMPWKNRRIGNPLLSGIGRLFFRCPAADFHCGLRAFSKTACAKLDLRTGGMEFASEMVIKATLHGLRVTEIPTTLRPAGRSRPPHLRPWRDGWRHLRFMLLFSPTGTFIVPGAVFLAVGGLGLIGVTARDGIAPDAALWLGSRHILTSLLFWLTGTSVLGLGVVAQEADYQERFDSHNPVSAFLHQTFSLEKGLIIGVALIAAGLLALLYFPLSFYAHLFPMGAEAFRLDCAVLAIASVLTGVQCAFASFALGLFYLRVK